MGWLKYFTNEETDSISLGILLWELIGGVSACDTVFAQFYIMKMLCPEHLECHLKPSDLNTFRNIAYIIVACQSQNKGGGASFIQNLYLKLGKM